MCEQAADTAWTWLVPERRDIVSVDVQDCRVAAFEVVVGSALGFAFS
jgi:hypothetical protein